MNVLIYLVDTNSGSYTTGVLINFHTAALSVHRGKEKNVSSQTVRTVIKQRLSRELRLRDFAVWTRWEGAAT